MPQQGITVGSANPIRKRRLELGLTQEQVSARLRREGADVSAQTVYHWETGKVKVPASKLSALDRALELVEGSFYLLLYGNKYYGANDGTQ